MWFISLGKSLILSRSQSSRGLSRAHSPHLSVKENCWILKNAEVPLQNDIYIIAIHVSVRLLKLCTIDAFIHQCLIFVRGLPVAPDTDTKKASRAVNQRRKHGYMTRHHVMETLFILHPTTDRQVTFDPVLVGAPIGLW